MGVSGYTALFCESMSYVDSLKEGKETVFCSISGMHSYRYSSSIKQSYENMHT